MELIVVRTIASHTMPAPVRWCGQIVRSSVFSIPIPILSAFGRGQDIFDRGKTSLEKAMKAEGILEALDLSAISPDGGPVELHIQFCGLALENTTGRHYATWWAAVRQDSQVVNTLGGTLRHGGAQAADHIHRGSVQGVDGLLEVQLAADLYHAFWLLYSALQARIARIKRCNRWELGPHFALIGDHSTYLTRKFLVEVYAWARQNLSTDEWDLPYMPFDLGSMIWALGYNPDLEMFHAAELLGMSLDEPLSPMSDVLRNIAVLDAVKQRDARLDQFKIQAN